MYFIQITRQITYQNMLIDSIWIIFSQTGNKKDAERLVKNIIKIVIKVSILQRNNQFNSDEAALADRFQSKFQVSFSNRSESFQNTQ